MKGSKLVPLVASTALAITALGSFAPAQADSNAGYVIGTITAAGQPADAYVDIVWCGTGAGGSAPNDCDSTDYIGYGSTDRAGRYVAKVDKYDYQRALNDEPTGVLVARPGSNESYFDAPAAVAGVSVTIGQNTVGPNFQLVSDGTTSTPPASGVVLTGLVTDPAGVPLDGAEVLAFNPVTGQQVGSTTTLPDGRFHFTASDPATWDPASGPYGAKNVSGSVKLWVWADHHVDEWSGDTRAKSRATAVPVAAYNAPAAQAPTMALQKLGSVTGTIKLPAAGPNWTADVTLYDADGTPRHFGRTDAAGNFSVDVPPGRYVLRADGARFTEASANDPSCPSCTEHVDEFGFLAAYYGGGTSFADAKLLRVGSAGTASAGTITLTNALKAVEKPRVKGKLAKGKTLKVANGVWNRKSDVTYSHAWRLGDKALGAGSSLKLSKKLWKQVSKKTGKLTVTVTATDARGELVDGSIKVSVKKALAKGGDKKGKGKKKKR